MAEADGDGGALRQCDHLESIEDQMTVGEEYSFFVRKLSIKRPVYGCRPSPRAEPHLKGLLEGTGEGASGWAKTCTCRLSVFRAVPTWWFWLVFDCEKTQRDIRDVAHILHFIGSFDFLIQGRCRGFSFFLYFLWSLYPREGHS